MKTAQMGCFFIVLNDHSDGRYRQRILLFYLPLFFSLAQFSRPRFLDHLSLHVKRVLLHERHVWLL